jgi:hypothetical protein
MGGYTLPYQDAVNYERTDRSKLMIMLPCMQTTVKWVHRQVGLLWLLAGCREWMASQVAPVPELVSQIYYILINYNYISETH